jgi:hypothetical protein
MLMQNIITLAFLLQHQQQEKIFSPDIHTVLG